MFYFTYFYSFYCIFIYFLPFTQPDNIFIGFYKELAPRKIRVNAVSPGPVHTNLGDGVFDKHPELIKPLADQTVLGRIGIPDDFGKVIMGLLSDDFGWMTAQDIEISGGFLL